MGTLSDSHPIAHPDLPEGADLKDCVAESRARAWAEIQARITESELDRMVQPWLPTKPEYSQLTADGVLGDRDAHWVVIAWWYWRAFRNIGHMQRQACNLLRDAITTWRLKKLGLVAPPSGIRLATEQERVALR